MQSIPKFKKPTLLLPGILLLITLFSGFLLVRFLEGVGMGYLRDQSENVIKAMAAGIQNEIRFSKAAASAMAGSPWVLPVFLDQNSENVKNANSVLDRYNTKLGFSVCYLLDIQGTTIASSNRNTPESFVGKNYAFRPYFQEALQGEPSFYIATEITSPERGFYAAHPVKNGQGELVGVVVVKKNIEAARDVLEGYPNSFYISPDGIIFISGSRDMVLKTLWPLDNERIRVIKDSKQFSVVSFDPIFLQPLQDGMRVRFRGESYQSFRRPLGPSGWSIVLLAPLKSVFYFVFLGWIITAFIAGIILISVLWVFGRIREQELLRKSEEKYRGLFLNSRDAIMIIQPPFWKFVSGNPATIEMFRAKNEEKFKSFGPWDLSPERQPDGSVSVQKAEEMIHTAILEGFCFFEWTHKRFNGEEFPATVLLTRIGQGQEMILLANVRDITKEKQSEKEMKQKVRELESFKKIAVDRELKMIELKEKIKALEGGGK